MDTDDQDARDLFPHSRRCTTNMHSRVVNLGQVVVCTCSAEAKRRNYLYLLNRARTAATLDAYARLRREAKARGERARLPLEQQVYEEIASWVEALELENLS